MLVNLGEHLARDADGLADAIDGSEDSGVLTEGEQVLADRLYDDDGNLTSRKVPGSVLKAPEVVKERVVNMVLSGEILSRNGKRLKQHLDTLCVHGDEPTGVIVARAARQGLEAAGVRVVPLPEMPLS